MTVRRDVVGRQSGQRADELTADDGGRLALFALGEQLAHADDRHQPGGQGGADLEIDLLVGFAQDVPALAVSQDDVAAAQVDQHRGADLAGEGAAGFVIHVLGAERDCASPGPRRPRRPDRRSAGKRRRRPAVAARPGRSLRLARATAAARSRFIFQFPAISERRMGLSRWTF